MASNYSNSLEAAMREAIAAMVDGCKDSSEEASYLGLDGIGSSNINSRGKRYPFLNSYNASGTYRAEGGNYPVAGTVQWLAMRAFVTNYALTAAYTERFLNEIDRPDVDAGGIDMYMSRDRRIILDNLAQDMFGDGSGTKAVANTVVTGTAGTVVCYVTVAGGSTFGCMKFMDGERVQFINPSTGLPRQNGTGSSYTSTVAVGGVNNPTYTLTFDVVPSDALQGDYIVRENSYAQAITGLDAGINNDSLDFQGVNRGVYRKTRSAVYDAATAPVSFSNINVVKYRLMARSTKKTKRDVLTSITMAQGMENLGHPIRRYTEATKMQDTGFDGFKIDGVEAMTFLYCRADGFYFVDKSEIEWNVLQAMKPIDRDGSIFRLAPTTSGGYSDNWLVNYVMEADLAYKNPRNLAKAINYSLTGLELAATSADL